MTVFTEPGWSSLGDLPDPPVAGAAITLAGSRLFLAGGYYPSPGPSSPTSNNFLNFDVGDPGGGWTPRTNLPIACCYAGLVECGGLIYLVGGVGDEEDLDTFQVWDPLNPSSGWTALPSLPTPNGQMYVAAVGGLIYCFGGVDDQNMAVVYDPDDPGAGWTALPAVPSGRVAGVAVVVDTDIHLIGGFNQGDDPEGAGAIQTFHTADATWGSGEIAELPEGMSGLGAAYSPEALHVYAVHGNSIDGMWSYDSVDGWEAVVVPTVVTHLGDTAAAAVDGVVYIPTAVLNDGSGGVLTELLAFATSGAVFGVRRFYPRVVEGFTVVDDVVLNYGSLDGLDPFAPDAVTGYTVVTLLWGQPVSLQPDYVYGWTMVGADMAVAGHIYPDPVVGRTRVHLAANKTLQLDTVVGYTDVTVGLIRNGFVTFHPDEMVGLTQVRIVYHPDLSENFPIMLAVSLRARLETEDLGIYYDEDNTEEVEDS